MINWLTGNKATFIKSPENFSSATLCYIPCLQEAIGLIVSMIKAHIIRYVASMILLWGQGFFLNYLKASYPYEL